MIINKIAVSMLLAWSAYGYASVEDMSAEQKRILAAANMSGELSAKNLNDMLEFTGIESSEIYDVVEKRFSADMASEDKVQEMAWLAKTLALSGDKKYQAVLLSAQEKGDKKLKKHISIALERIDKFSAYNKVLSKNLESAPAGGLEHQRVQNALGSDYPDLIRWGAKRVFFALYLERDLVGAAFNTLKIQLPKAKTDEEVDATSWLIKAVGSYGNAEEKAFIREIAENKSKQFEGKFVKYAKISLK